MKVRDFFLPLTKNLMEELLKLKPSKLIIVITFLLATVGPGILYIYIFNRDMFYNVDTIKIILLSLSVTTPILIFNLFVDVGISIKKLKPENYEFHFGLKILLHSGYFSAGSYLCIIGFYLIEVFTKTYLINTISMFWVMSIILESFLLTFIFIKDKFFKIK